MLCGYIDDGYTEPGCVAEEPGIYPEVQFEFRPMLPTEYAVVLKSILANDYQKIRRDFAEAVGSRVRSWNLKDRHGNTVPLGTDSMLKLKEPLLTQLFQIVACQRASDGRSDITDHEADSKN